MRGGTRLVRERCALLRLLGAAGPGAYAALAVALVATALLPAFAAAATGTLVGRVASSGGDLGGAAGPLALVGVLLFLDLAAPTFVEPFRRWVAMSVNGRIRRRIRRAVAAPAGIDHLEDQAVRDAAALPVDDTYLVNLGAGAEGQLWLLARFAGGAGCAYLVARYSVWLAVFTLGVMLLQRSRIRRQYVGTVSTAAPGTVPEGRVAAYWSDLLTSPAGGREARLFGFGPWALAGYRSNAEVHVRVAEALYRRILPRQWTTFALSALGAGVPFAMLGRGAVDGRLTPAALAAALGGVVGLFRMGAMGYEAYSIETAVAHLPALASLAELERRAPVAAPPSGVPATAPTIVFEDVWFGYPGRPDVLRGLDLTVRPGEQVAIVGENGAGKTTLIKLLCGFYVPRRGRILVDGTDLRDLDPAAWRRRLAVIFQEFVRFELPAADNVALSAVGGEHDEEALDAAAAAAGAAGIVAALPHGWATTLSRSYTGGVELSGGQWQRIGLARALFAARAGGRVLVLDEPTASLDVHAETALFDQLLTHAEGSTAIVISHRFSTVRRAGRIVVLGEGRVVEDGSHEDLLARDGRYATLFRLQADRFATGEAS